MFENGSSSTGIQKNELDGVMDKFNVQNEGKETVYHDNLPALHKFYAFVVSKQVD
jgi:hypothetical protein